MRPRGWASIGRLEADGPMSERFAIRDIQSTDEPDLAAIERVAPELDGPPGGKAISSATGWAITRRRVLI